MPPPPPSGSIPPPPAPGNPAPVPGASGFQASDAIGYGWKKFQDNVGRILLAILALIVFTVVVELIAGVITGSGFDEDANDFSIGGSLFRIITLSGGFIASAFVIRGALDITEGRKFDIASAIKQLNIVNVLLTSLLVAVITSIGYALLWIPGIIAQFLLLFAVYFAVDKGTNAIDSVKSSFTLVKDNIGATIMLILLSIVVAIAGLIALCIGLLVALPVIAIAWAYAYKTLLGEPVAA
ncbi:hypothetical protein GCM10022234_34760 [Aeromicrobium panaciterrae]